MLACMTFGFALTARAQFPSSDEVYCYQYYKTVDNGVISKKDVEYNIFHVNFNDDIMGFTCNSATFILNKMASEPNYFNSKAIDDARGNKSSYTTYFYGETEKFSSTL